MGLPREKPEEQPKLRPTGDSEGSGGVTASGFAVLLCALGSRHCTGVYLARSGAGACGNAGGAFPVALSSTHQHKMAQAGLLPPKLLPRDEILLMI